MTSDINMPTPNGSKIEKSRFGIAPITCECAPTYTRNALPDIPGKSKNVHAKKPNIISAPIEGVNGPSGGYDPVM